MTNPRRIYTGLLWLLLPYACFHLLWRGRKQPEYLRHIGERFGFYAPRTDRPVIWLHTVSVGETRATVALVQGLLKAYPNHQLLLTHTTPTGRATSEQLFSNDVLRVYLPYDYPCAVRRFLRHFQPQVGVLLETEIWFNLIHLCRAGKVPLLLLNARLSEKSAARYARFPALTRQGLRGLAAIAAQTEADAQRLRILGGENISLMGNLKFDIEPPAAMLELGEHLRETFGPTRKVFLAASTREGEETLLLAALKQAKIAGLLSIIVPRHPQRFDAVAALIAQHGFRYQRRSEHAAIAADTEVVLGDSMGEMFAYYAACDIAFIGGSLLPFGGQNLIEACAVGKPVLLGLHTYNFEQACQQAIQQGVAQRITDAQTLVQTLQELFNKPAFAQDMGAAGLEFVRANQGATNRATELISHQLDHSNTTQQASLE